MLYRLQACNFFSIKDRLDLDFRVAKNVPESERQFDQPLANDSRVPRVISFFGPNASGKSTVLRLLWFMDWFIEDSLDHPSNAAIPISPFASTDGWVRDIEISLEFSADLLARGKTYLYRYEIVCNSSQGFQVKSETLSYKPGRKFRKLFERIGSSVKPSKDFDIRDNDPRREALNPRASAISALAKFGHEKSDLIKNTLGLMLSSNISIYGRRNFKDETANDFYNSFKHHFDAFQSFSDKLDLGIEEIMLEEQDKKFHPYFSHRGLDFLLPLAYESEGTQHVYKFFPTLSMALMYGGIAVVDELDSNVHPYVLSEIVRMFRDSDLNKTGAQLIFNCHNPSILEHLSKEEVFLVTKSRDGGTSAYGLATVAGLRRDANLYQKYISGSLGGLPTLG